MRAIVPDVDLVFNAWRSRRPNPNLVSLTDSRRTAIRARLREHPAEHLIVLIEYAHESLTGEARFWRGDSEDGREYMDLINLFRANKCAARVERAWAWKHGLRGAPRDVEAQHGVEDVPDVNLGPMAAFRGSTGPVAPARPRLGPAQGQPVIGRVMRRGKA